MAKGETKKQITQRYQEARKKAEDNYGKQLKAYNEYQEAVKNKKNPRKVLAGIIGAKEVTSISAALRDGKSREDIAKDNGLSELFGITEDTLADQQRPSSIGDAMARFVGGGDEVPPQGVKLLILSKNEDGSVSTAARSDTYDRITFNEDQVSVDAEGNPDRQYILDSAEEDFIRITNKGKFTNRPQATGRAFVGDIIDYSKDHETKSISYLIESITKGDDGNTTITAYPPSQFGNQNPELITLKPNQYSEIKVTGSKRKETFLAALEQAKKEAEAAAEAEAETKPYPAYISTFIRSFERLRKSEKEGEGASEKEIYGQLTADQKVVYDKIVEKAQPTGKFEQAKETFGRETAPLLQKLLASNNAAKRVDTKKLIDDILGPKKAPRTGLTVSITGKFSDVKASMIAFAREGAKTTKGKPINFNLQISDNVLTDAERGAVSDGGYTDAQKMDRSETRFVEYLVEQVKSGYRYNSGTTPKQNRYPQDLLESGILPINPTKLGAINTRVEEEIEARYPTLNPDDVPPPSKDEAKVLAKAKAKAKAKSKAKPKDTSTDIELKNVMGGEKVTVRVSDLDAKIVFFNNNVEAMASAIAEGYEIILPMGAVHKGEGTQPEGTLRLDQINPAFKGRFNHKTHYSFDKVAPEYADPFEKVATKGKGGKQEIVLAEKGKDSTQLAFERMDSTKLVQPEDTLDKKILVLSRYTKTVEPAVLQQGSQQRAERKEQEEFETEGDPGRQIAAEQERLKDATLPTREFEKVTKGIEGKFITLPEALAMAGEYYGKALTRPVNSLITRVPERSLDQQIESLIQLRVAKEFSSAYIRQSLGNLVELTDRNTRLEYDYSKVIEGLKKLKIYNFNLIKDDGFSAYESEDGVKLTPDEESKLRLSSFLNDVYADYVGGKFTSDTTFNEDLVNAIINRETSAVAKAAENVALGSKSIPSSLTTTLSLFFDERIPATADPLSTSGVQLGGEEAPVPTEQTGIEQAEDAQSLLLKALFDGRSEYERMSGMSIRVRNELARKPETTSDISRGMAEAQEVVGTLTPTVQVYRVGSILAQSPIYDATSTRESDVSIQVGDKIQSFTVIDSDGNTKDINASDLKPTEITDLLFGSGKYSNAKSFTVQFVKEDGMPHTSTEINYVEATELKKRQDFAEQQAEIEFRKKYDDTFADVTEALKKLEGYSGSSTFVDGFIGSITRDEDLLTSFKEVYAIYLESKTGDTYDLNSPELKDLDVEEAVTDMVVTMGSLSIDSDQASANSKLGFFRSLTSDFDVRLGLTPSPDTQSKSASLANAAAPVRLLLKSILDASIAAYNGADVSGAFGEFTLAGATNSRGYAPSSSVDAQRSADEAFFLDIIKPFLRDKDGEPIEFSELDPPLQDYVVNQVSKRVIKTFGRNVVTTLKARSRPMTKAEQDVAEKSNIQEAKALGLKSGDPESVKRALKNIVNNEDYPLYLQATAKALLDSEVTWADTKFEMGSYDGRADFVGRYNPKTNTVSLNLRGSNGKSLASVLIHEYLHVMTYKTINDPSGATSPVVSSLRKSYEEIRDLYEKADPRSRSLEMDEGLSSLDEFVSYFFTSSTFQIQIKRLAAEVGDTVAEKKNFFRRVIDSILDIIGISKADRRTTRVFDQLVDMLYYLPKGEPFRLRTEFARAAKQAREQLEREEEPRPRFNEPTERLAPMPTAPVAGSEAAQRPSVSSPQDPNYRTIEPLDTESQKVETLKLVSRIRQLGSVPAEVPIVVDYDYPHSFAIEPSGVMVINPERHLNDLLNLDIESGTPAHDLFLEAALDEEMAHVADINSLSEEEITEFAKSLTDEELTRIGEKYFDDPEYELPTDPADKADAVRLLASERLRMTFQNVIRGKQGDTESVIAYLRSSDKTKTIEAAYFDRALSSLRYKARLKALSPKERGLINQMIDERRRMALNYRSSNPYATQGLSGEALERNVEILLSQATVEPEDELEEKAKEIAKAKEEKRSSKTKVEFADQNEHYNFNLEAPVTETLSGDFLTTFNLTLAAQEAQDILGGTVESTRKRKVELLVAHYLSDLPEGAGVSASVIGGVGASTLGGAKEPTVRVDISTDNEAALDQVRSRMYALASLLEQQELHEIEELYVPEGVDIEYGLKEGGFEDQPAGVIKLNAGVDLLPEMLDPLVKQSGLGGYTFAGQEILIYNTDDNPEQFTSKFEVITTTITDQFKSDDIKRPITNVQQTSVRLRRTSKEGDSSKGITSYEEGYLPDGAETAGEAGAATDARVAVARNILRNTGGRITNPVGTQRLLFSGAVLSPERQALLTKLAEIYDELPDRDDSAQTRQAYDSLIKKTKTKFSNLFGEGRGKIKVIITDGDPYADQESLVNDIRNGQIKIQRSNFDPRDTHPMYAAVDGITAVDESDVEVSINGDEALRTLFRFAQHGITGSVSPEGAYTHLVSMFSDGTREGRMAAWAAATEIRSEEAYKRFGPENDKKPGEVGYVPVAERKGPPVRKVALLPLGFAKTGNEAVDSGLDNLAKSISEDNSDLLRGSYKPKEKAEAPAEAPAETTPQGQAPLPAAQVGGEAQPDQPTQAESTTETVEETVPYRLPASETDYTDFFETFEMPIFEVGAYTTPSKGFMRALKGPYDRRIRMMLSQASSAQRGAMLSMERYKEQMFGIISKMDADEQVRINRLISKASGYTGSLITTKQFNEVQKKYDAMMKSITDAEGSSAYPADVFADMVTLVLEANPNLSQEKAEAKALKELDTRKFDQIKQLRSKELDRVKKENRLKRGEQQAQAFAQLQSENPKLAKIVVDLRTQIDGLSAKLSKSLGDDHLNLSVTIDDNLGIYVTRSFKFFEDADYAKAVSDPNTGYNDPAYGLTLEKADLYFKNFFIKGEKKRLKEAKGIPEDQDDPEIDAEALDNYNNKEVDGISHGKRMRIDFLKRYTPGKVSKDTLASNGDAIDVIIDNLRRRDDKPEVIQELFGVYGEEHGAANLIKTLGIVATHAANHSMLNSLKKTAESPTDSAGKWIYSPEEIAGSEETRQEGQILESQLPEGYARIPGDLGNSVFSPLQGHFAPFFLVDALKKASAERFQSSEGNPATEILRQSLSRIKQISGVGMLSKVLFSVGHFARNMAGQSMMAIAQGRPQLMVTSLPHLKDELGYVGFNLVGKEISDEKFAERMARAGLGIVGNEMRSRTIQDLLRGETTMADVQDEMNSLFKKADSLKDVVSAKTVKPLMDRLLELEAATENFMKIAVFLDNVKVLEKAVAEGSGKIYGVDLSQMGPREIDKYAAELTLDTMPAHSRTTPLVQAISRTPIADLLSPFIRFTTEVYRTQVNGYRTASMEIKSGNSVLRNRGAQRLAGLLTAHSLSAFGTVMINALLSDIDLEDEDNLDESLPSYLKDHAIIYFKGKHVPIPLPGFREGGRDEMLFSADLTFLDPLSPIGNVITPALQSLVLDEGPDDAVIGVLGSLLNQTFGATQIVAGAVSDAFYYNKDSSTGSDISIEGVDEPFEAFRKKLTYVYEKGLEPRVVKDARELGRFLMQQGDYEEDQYDAAAIIRNHVAPIRIRPLDLQRNYRSAMYSLNEKNQDVRKGVYKLATRKALTPGEVDNITQGFFDKSFGLHKKGLGIAQTHLKLGLDPGSTYGIMKDVLGTGFADTTSEGFYYPPDIPDSLSESLTRPERAGNYGLLRERRYMRNQFEYGAKSFY